MTKYYFFLNVDNNLKYELDEHRFTLLIAVTLKEMTSSRSGEIGLFKCLHTLIKHWKGVTVNIITRTKKKTHYYNMHYAMRSITLDTVREYVACTLRRRSQPSSLTHKHRRLNITRQTKFWKFLLPRRVYTVTALCG